jgi:hypothetical protein
MKESFSSYHLTVIRYQFKNGLVELKLVTVK